MKHKGAAHNHEVQSYLNRTAQRRGRSVKDEEMPGEAGFEGWVQTEWRQGKSPNKTKFLSKLSIIFVLPSSWRDLKWLAKIYSKTSRPLGWLLLKKND